MPAPLWSGHSARIHHLPNPVLTLGVDCRAGLCSVAAAMTQLHQIAFARSEGTYRFSLRRRGDSLFDRPLPHVAPSVFIRIRICLLPPNVPVATHR